MLGLNPFIELLYRSYVHEVTIRSKGSKNQKLKSITGTNEIVAKAILKMSFGSEKFLQPEDLLRRVKDVQGQIKRPSDFSGIVESTLFEHRKHEDQIRYFDFVLCQTRNDNLANHKHDGRKHQPKVEITELILVKKSMDQLESNTKFKIEAIEYFNEFLKLSDSKQRLGKFNQKFTEVSHFISQYYEYAPDGGRRIEPLFELKKELRFIGDELSGALNSNPKDQKFIDAFMFLTFELLKEDCSEMESDDRLKKIAIGIGLQKGLSKENLFRMKKDGRAFISKNKNLNKRYQKYF